VGGVLGHAAMRGPAGMADTGRPRRQIRHRVADLAGPLLEDHLVAVANGHAPGVVAPILELLEPSEHQVRRVPIVAAVTEDSAHGCPPVRGRNARRARSESRAGSAAPPAPWAALVGTLPRRFAPPITTVPAEGPPPA